MGKCASKPKNHHDVQEIREIDERSYMAISDDYYRYEVRDDNVEIEHWRKQFTEESSVWGKEDFLSIQRICEAFSIAQLRKIFLLSLEAN